MADNESGFPESLRAEFVGLLDIAAAKIYADVARFKQEQLALFKANPDDFEGTEVDDILVWYTERDFDFS